MPEQRGRVARTGEALHESRAHSEGPQLKREIGAGRRSVLLTGRAGRDVAAEQIESQRARGALEAFVVEEEARTRERVDANDRTGRLVVDTVAFAVGRLVSAGGAVDPRDGADATFDPHPALDPERPHAAIVRMLAALPAAAPVKAEADAGRAPVALLAVRGQHGHVDIARIRWR